MKTIITHISDGNTEGALLELEKLYTNTKYEKHVAVLRNRFNSYKQKEILNITSNHDLQIELNKINFDILELLNQPKTEDAKFRKNYYLTIGALLVILIGSFIVYRLNTSENNNCVKYKQQYTAFISMYESKIAIAKIDMVDLDTINNTRELLYKDYNTVECDIPNDEKKRIAYIVEKNFILINELIDKNKELLLAGKKDKELINIKKIISLCDISLLLCKYIECSNSYNKLLNELIANFSNFNDESK